MVVKGLAVVGVMLFMSSSWKCGKYSLNLFAISVGSAITVLSASSLMVGNIRLVFDIWFKVFHVDLESLLERLNFLNSNLDLQYIWFPLKFLLFFGRSIFTLNFTMHYIRGLFYSYQQFKFVIDSETIKPIVTVQRSLKIDCNDLWTYHFLKWLTGLASIKLQNIASRSNNIHTSNTRLNTYSGFDINMIYTCCNW